MAFKKWIDIENSHNDKFVSYYLEKFPELLKEKFIVSEKLDGANFSFIFYPDGHFEVAKRSGLVKEGDKFYNYKEAMEEDLVKRFIHTMVSYCINLEVTLQFIGELFGGNVQNRVWYGKENHWRYFGVYQLFEAGVSPFKVFSHYDMDMLAGIILTEYDFDISLVRVPVLHTHATFEEALNFNIERNSELTPIGYDRPNLIEGVVIRPENDYCLKYDVEPFILKLKNEKFMDRPKTKEAKKFNASEDYASLLEIAKGFINENRTADLMSKYGVIQSVRDFGDYIRYYMEDFLNDFEKEYSLEYMNITKEEQKNLRKVIAGLIKNELSGIINKRKE